MFGLTIPALLRSNWILIGGVLLALLGIQTMRVSSLKKDVALEKSARAQDIALWRAAGIQATATALKEKGRIETAQSKETARAEALKSNLDLIGGKYQRLLATKTNLGSPGKANLRGNVGCPGLDVDQGTCDRFLAYRDRSGRLAERAERDAFQLNALIDLYNAQHSIDRTTP